MHGSAKILKEIKSRWGSKLSPKKVQQPVGSELSLLVSSTLLSTSTTTRNTITNLASASYKLYQTASKMAIQLSTDTTINTTTKASATTTLKIPSLSMIHTESTFLRPTLPPRYTRFPISPNKSRSSTSSSRVY
jgi:hypothetical protein